MIFIFIRQGKSHGLDLELGADWPGAVGPDQGKIWGSGQWGRSYGAHAGLARLVEGRVQRARGGVIGSRDRC